MQRTGKRQSLIHELKSGNSCYTLYCYTLCFGGKSLFSLKILVCHKNKSRLNLKKRVRIENGGAPVKTVQTQINWPISAPIILQRIDFLTGLFNFILGFIPSYSSSRRPCAPWNISKLYSFSYCPIHLLPIIGNCFRGKTSCISLWAAATEAKKGEKSQ